jgi:hypothetical protein
MKKVMIMAMFAISLSADGDVIKNLWDENNLCREVTTTKKDGFGVTRESSVPLLYALPLYISNNDDATTVLAKMMIEATKQMTKNGVKKDSPKWTGLDSAMVAGSINGVLIAKGWTGSVSNVTIETGNSIGKNGSLKKVISVDIAILSNKIAHYLVKCIDNEDSIKKEILIRSFIIETTKPTNVTFSSRCSKDGRKITFDGLDSYNLAVEFAIFITNKSSIYNYGLVDAFLNHSTDYITEYMLKIPNVKKTLDTTIEKIAADKEQQEIKKAAKLIQNAKLKLEVTQGARGLEILAKRRTEPLGTCYAQRYLRWENDLKSFKEKGLHLNYRIYNIRGSDFVFLFSTNDPSGFWGPSPEIIQAIPLSLCFTVNEDKESRSKDQSYMEQYRSDYLWVGDVQLTDKDFKWAKEKFKKEIEDSLKN